MKVTLIHSGRQIEVSGELYAIPNALAPAEKHRKLDQPLLMRFAQYYDGVPIGMYPANYGCADYRIFVCDLCVQEQEGREMVAHGIRGTVFELYHPKSGATASEASRYRIKLIEYGAVDEGLTNLSPNNNSKGNTNLLEINSNDEGL